MATFAATTTTPSTTEAARPSAWATLAVLFVVYALNYLDRTLIYILFGPIKSELALSDLQLALLGSTSFVLFYTLLGVPFGRLADRVSRRNMIAAGLATWSLASACTGLMSGFAGLFLCRVVVGIGEATLAPAALSLLADLFPARQRATAAALYSAGIPLGAGLAMWLGGAIGESWGWRPAFLALGLPGALLAVGVLAWLPEPARPTVERRETQAGGGFGAVLRDPAFSLQVLGYAVFAIATNAMPMWVPALLRARFDLGLAEVGWWMGMCAVLGGLVGSAAGGVVADRWQRRTPAGRAAFGALVAAVAAGAWLVVLSGPTFPIAIAAVGVSMALSLAWLGPAATDVQELAGVANRGLAVGVYLFVVNATGHGFGPPVLGWLNDRVGASEDPLLLSTSLLVAPAASVAGAALLGAAALARSRRRSALPA